MNNRKFLATALVVILAVNICFFVNFQIVKAERVETQHTLVSSVQSLIDKLNFTADIGSAYMGTTFGKTNLNQVQAMVDNLSPITNWKDILYWYNILSKYGLENQTTISNALYHASMMPNGLPDSTGQLSFLVYDRYLILSYAFAQNFNYLKDKWNITIAFQNFNTSVYYSKAHSNGLAPLWIYGDNTAQPFTGRYYDEIGQTLDTYLDFYQLGMTSALQEAVKLWDFENTNYFDGTHYGYLQRSGVYECEAGGFCQIITKLQHYDPTINITNLLIDVENRYLSGEWNSPQWNEKVIQHANTNPQLRLQNTLIDWNSIMGLDTLLPAQYQEKVGEMLLGNNSTQAAWALISGSELYDPSNGLYRWWTDDTFGSNFPTTMALNLMFQLGIVQGTGQLAVPIQEIKYEDFYNIVDNQLYRMDLATETIQFAVAQPGNFTFQFGSNPVTSSFNTGIWNLTFSSDWNSITSINYAGSLPINRIYYQTSIVQHSIQQQIPQYIPVPVAANSTNTIELYANSTLIFKGSVCANSSVANCFTNASSLNLGTYELLACINGSRQSIGNLVVTFTGDLSGDGKLNFLDTQKFVSLYVQSNKANGSYQPQIDFDYNDRVNFNDIQIFVSIYIFYYTKS